MKRITGSSYMVQLSDNGVLLLLEGASVFTLNLPTQLPADFVLMIRNQSSPTLTITPNALDGIGGAPVGTSISPAGKFLTLVYYGVPGTGLGNGWYTPYWDVRNGGTGTPNVPTDAQILIASGGAYVPTTVNGDGTLSTLGSFAIGAGKVDVTRLTSQARPNLNYLINGGFDVNQRNLGALSVVSGTDKFAVDRWKVAVGNTDVTFSRVDTNTSLEAGLNARYYGKFTKATNTAKIMLYQWIEGVNVLPLAGRTVTFQCKIKATLTSANKKFRIGIVQLNSSGTIDTIGASIFSAPNVASTDPTPTAASNFAYVTTAIAVPTGAQGSQNGNAVDCTTTTAWQLFGVSVTMPANMKNIAVAIWSDDTMTATDFVAISEAQFVDGGSIRDWLPLPYQQEEVRCMRHYEKRLSGGTNNMFGSGYCNAGGAGTARYSIPFKVRKRIVPAIAVSALADIGHIRQGGIQIAASTFSNDASDVDAANIIMSAAAGLTAGEGMQCYWVNGTGFLAFEAEL